ncbi:DUF6612 family protein [Shouchella clausii]|jgi:hypothetical protein|uniref:DUF6612 family protein n=1 Tax=Shouchella clausii TaxID=79880 RepID=UPI000B96E7B6|nr:DUF6612 family protein [Shouchella clausii]SPT78331.1 Uncharacterised protein [Niallia circulans]AST96064.1 hypothetical protein BC8716_08925 [Shouchella clausii]MBU8595972.1 hypothetical protein [Shouchella clausii]MCR1290067.1 hypothetical protein [Shouchella clausii]MCY1103159.1 hypothetical protein [Shouchella clausii]
MKKGNRMVLSHVFLGMLVFLPACSMSAEDEDLSKVEAVIAQVIKRAEMVNSYALEFEVRDDIAWGDGDISYTHSMLSGLSFSNPQRGYYQMTEVEGNGETETTVFTDEIYEDEDAVYVNFNQEGWIKSESYNNYSETGFEAMIQLLKEIKNMEEIIIEETEEAFEVSFPDMAEVLYEFYDPAISIMEGDAFVETGVPEAFIKIDKEDYSVREFTTKFFYDARTGSSSERVVTIEYRFDDINEIRDIKIPDEVIEEAEANE